MKVLRVISSMDPSTGGPCQGIRNSVPALEKLGIFSEVLCLDSPDASYIKNELFPIHAIGNADNSWRYHYKLIPWLISNLGNYDAVIVHGLWLYHSYAVWQAIRKLKKQLNNSGLGLKIPPYYVMPHGMLDPYFQKASGRKIKAFRNWIYWKLIESKVINNSAGLFFTCEEELLLARKPFKPYAPPKEINVGYGIGRPPELTDNMLDSFYEKCPEVRNKRFFLFLSRINVKKGVLELLDAYEMIRSALPDIENEFYPLLVIAGPGLDTPYGTAVKKTVADSSALSNAVYFTGMLTFDAKWGAYYASAAFILPSHQENFGIAVAEALACGKPVLISNKVNIWREIEQAGAGIVKNDDVDGVTGLINSWIELTDIEKENMVVNAKKIYETKFAIEPNAILMKNALIKTVSHQL